MKKLFMIIFMIATLGFVSDVVDAYPITVEVEANKEFDAYITGCSDSDCSTLESRSYTDTYDSFGKLVDFTITGSGTLYTAEYYYKEGYMPFAFISRTTNSASGTHKKTISFTTENSCKAEIKDIDVEHDRFFENGDDVDIEIRVESGFDRGDIPDDMVIPSSIAEFYSSEIEVTVEIFDADSGEFIDSFEDEEEILMGETKKIEITWDDAIEGDYDIEVTTEVIDDACEKSKKDSDTISIDIKEGTGETFSERRRRVLTSGNSVSETSLNTNQIEYNVRPGDVINVDLELSNSNTRDKDFEISIKDIKGFTAIPFTVEVPARRTKDASLFIDVEDPREGIHSINIFSESDGKRLTKTIRVNVDWDIDFTFTPVVNEREGVVNVNYVVDNMERFSTSGIIIIKDGQREARESVSIGANGITTGTITYPIDEPGAHQAFVEFESNGKTQELEELTFSANNNRGTGATGLFVAGGSIIGGIIVLLLLVLFIFWYYENRKAEQKPTDIIPIIQAVSAKKDEKPHYYSSIFSNDAK